MNRLRHLLPLMLLSLGSSPELTEKHRHDAAGWWAEFVREMEAIGCINIRENPETGEWEFDCPESRLAEAKRIVNRYKMIRA